MKKLLAICAAAALALGIAGCANEDATLSVDDALATTKQIAAFEDAVAKAEKAAENGSLWSADSAELWAGAATKVTTSFSNDFYTVLSKKKLDEAYKKDSSKVYVEGYVKATSADDTLVTTEVDDDNIVTVTAVAGVPNSETSVTLELYMPDVSEEPIATLDVPVTVKAAAGINFGGLNEAKGTSETDKVQVKSLAATVLKLPNDDTEYLSATELKYELSEIWEEKSLTLGKNYPKGETVSNNGGFAYNVKSSEKTQWADQTEFGSFYTIVTAKAKVQLAAYDFNVASGSGKTYGRIRIYEYKDNKAGTLLFDSTIDTKTKGKPSAVVSSSDILDSSGKVISVAKDAQIKVVISAYAAGAKASDSNVSFSTNKLQLIVGPEK